MNTGQGSQVETIDGRDYTVAEYPRDWASWPFAAKATWLQSHTSPRCTYPQACAILSAHAAARRRAEAEHRAKAEQEMAAKVASGSPLMSVEAAGQQLVRFGRRWCGYTLAQIAQKDPGYLEWMAGRDWIKGELREAVLVLCHHHRDAIAAARRGQR